MEIYTVLKEDHKALKKILAQLDDTREASGPKRLSLLQKLKDALAPHARAEEIVLYDRMKKSAEKDADALAFEGYEEHAVADHILEELEGVDPSDQKWTALISVLKENLEHHIKEEESELFKKAKKSFDRPTARAMTDEFKELKKHFKEELDGGGTNDPRAPSLAEFGGPMLF
jgi:hemerythrin-like domain-containing protein